ncbi:hypothetical protein BRETT_001899 [Brettanomyces bruxellensis]|uniref:S-formylglutathione hydrolase n=1 Tax=Dekkera bruxellensis TaxID=5007 RepID=A0A871R903_DEKBR|nr:uncharacterized protein BRETT_001899 [Brettanomyces bruxellensis]QOU21736.1 hypothetical protein BRETT_001899 [Brettanomyces bruxellensis]
MSFNIDEKIPSFDGKLLKLSHNSPITHTKMLLSLYLPHQYFEKADNKVLPVILFLSGLNCSPDNPTEKSFIQPYANMYGFSVLFPDTSPRINDVRLKKGIGSSFYLDATENPWCKNFKMYSYIMKDLIPNIGKEFPKLDTDNMSICGHSMGGFGALMFYLKTPERFKSCSAFAPLTHPSICPGENKFFKLFLGLAQSEWKKYDPCELIKTYNGPKRPILIHQGTGDKYYIGKELLPEDFVKASEGTILEGLINIKFKDGYGHNYYLVSSFMAEQCLFHAKYLGLI